MVILQVQLVTFTKQIQLGLFLQNLLVVGSAAAECHVERVY